MIVALRLVLAIGLSASAWPASAQDLLHHVRELYASADYEAAMAALDRVRPDPGDDTTEIDRYRALCLIALGRTAEADRVIERVVTAHPLAELDATDSSPAVRAAFSAVRRRVLPGLARRLFADAKAAYDRKALAEAADKFQQAFAVLDSPHLPAAADLADLRALTAGFWELTRDALPKPAKPKSTSPTAAGGPVTTTAATPSAGAPAAADPASDPTPIQQPMPRWTFAVAAAHYDAHFRATVEVEIDELGRVASVEIIQSSHPGFNPELLKTARGWTYRPTLRNGQPVKARKRVTVVLRPQ